MTLDACLGAEERGVEMSQEARDLLAQRDATIAQLTTVNAQRQREKAQRDAKIAQLTAANAEKDCRSASRVVTRTATATPQQSCISTYRPGRPRRSRVSELPRTRTSRSLAPGRKARRAVVNERGAASQERGSGGDCDAIAVSRSSRGNRDVSTDFRGNQKKPKKGRLVQGGRTIASGLRAWISIQANLTALAQTIRTASVLWSRISSPGAMPTLQSGSALFM